MENKYHAVFKGKLVEGSNRNQTNLILSKIFKLNDSKQGSLYSGKAFVIKKHITNEQALDLQKKFLKYGIVIEFLKLKNIESPSDKNDHHFCTANLERKPPEKPSSSETKATVDIWYAIKSTVTPHFYLTLIFWFIPAVWGGGAGIEQFLAVNFLTLAYSVPVWLATSKGYIVDIDKNEFTFPASDVENSILEILTLKKIRNMMHRNTIKITEIRALNNEKGRRRSSFNFDPKRKKPPMKDQWLLNVSGEFGSQQFEFDSKQKRDECRSMIFTACMRKGNRLRGASDFNLDL